ncbi:3-isopropylmalate dehydrogenase [Candidatus Atribacteria bacterium HGW-Atribacteria-1]|nr:MAG: 3-isopropylmalate dehydrogenase [Candidatus Atribacteria bacterium HGW-Atribacteria-1]
MAKYKIAWLPGDGIGNDVMEAVKIVLEELKLDADYLPGDVGWEFWKKEGNPLPDRTIKILKETDCCLFGAITSKPKEEAEKELAPELKGKGYIYSSPIVRLRQEFKLHTNLRPCKAYKGNPLNYRDDIDLVVFRENTEGLYSGVEFHPLPGDLMESLLKNHPKMKRFKETPLEDIALSCRIFTRKACQSIVRQGFEYAKKFNRNSVTVIEKPNIIRETSGFQIYSVLVSSNMFGDIVSDLCAQLIGGLGFASSANIGDNYALFEPTHGSAPKYAGQYKVNPMAMLLTVKLMLDYLEEKELAQRLEKAIARVIEEGKVRTYDLGGTASTLEVAREVAKKVISDQ